MKKMEMAPLIANANLILKALIVDPSNAILALEIIVKMELIVSLQQITSEIIKF